MEETANWRWERRDAKQDAKRRRMPVTGRGLLTVLRKKDKPPQRKQRRRR
jgi:hypothetical protein